MQTNYFDESLSTEQFLENDGWKLYIKRDDLIHPIVSGNKWRKLKYALQYMHDNNIKKMLTFGGAFSNHTLACACVCALHNIQLTVISRGEKSVEPNHYQQFLKAFKAKVIYVSREAYRDKETLKSDYNATKDTFVLDEGGKHKLADQGCQEIIESLNLEYDAIFLASGTGTTALGIANAIKNKKLKTTLYIVPVLKNETEIEEILKGFSFAN